MNTRDCPTCGHAFVPNPHKKKQTYCSRPCFFKAREKQVHKTCERCGKPFSIYQARASARYCSWACRSGKIEQKCAYCGGTYVVKAGHAHKRSTCSRRCAALKRAAEGRTPQQGKEQSLETRQKVSAGLRRYYSGDASKHWNYQGGAFSYKRGPSWQEQRRKARARDGYCCRVCGVTEKALGKQLSVHHIKPFRFFANSFEANHLDNLICTCQSCHMKLEHGTIPMPSQDNAPLA